MTPYQIVFFASTLLFILLYSFSCLDWLIFTRRSGASGRTKRLFLAMAAGAFYMAFSRWFLFSLVGQGVVHQFYPDYRGASEAVFFSLWVMKDTFGLAYWGYLFWLLRGGNGEDLSQEANVMETLVQALRESQTALRLVTDNEESGPEQSQAVAALLAANNALDLYDMLTVE